MTDDTGTEITVAGYSDLNIGNLIATNWSFIELQTSTGVKIIRIPKSDARVTQVSLDSQHVVYDIVLHGSDSDITAKGFPQTFGKAAFKRTDSDIATILAVDSFDLAMLNSASDELTITISAGIIT